ncbi:FmdE, molybdenum formylmethanofuran dehydrogenase operon [Peptococcaceae bacterium CEB3]|nr:FmdE, molybdenum formylmethanofuran dehydrogenase operon [Peptococcaceae bacterium CEB3]
MSNVKDSPLPGLSKHELPDWAFEFHGHKCPFMPLGYRMGRYAMELLGVEKEKDHGMFVFSEMGEGHPQTCMMDGLQIATGCTYGKNLLTRLNYGKVAAVFYHPQKGAVRISVPTKFQEEIGKFEFFVYRKKGIEPSAIPDEVVDEVVHYVMTQPIETMAQVRQLPDFKYAPTPGSFNKVVCSECGETVFERYARTVGGKVLCIPCSGYERTLGRKPIL